jgi:hypothetical protein
MVWQVHTVGIVVRVVGLANHEMIARHVILSPVLVLTTKQTQSEKPSFHRRSEKFPACGVRDKDSEGRVEDRLNKLGSAPDPLCQQCNKASSRSGSP